VSGGLAVNKPVLGYHVIFGAYGFWLPNDPRGSWSDFVGAWGLFLAGGRATKTTETRSLARDPHDRAKRLATKQALSRPAVKFTGVQARAVGRGFATAVEKSGFPVWACSVLPEHVHLVVGRSRLTVEQVAILLKGEATKQLSAEDLHPLGHLAAPGKRPPKCWSRGEWSVFLDDPDDIVRCVRYVEDSPLKEGKPRQTWPFVTPYSPA
jgi:REP element-mobilizing transposase RayT